MLAALLLRSGSPIADLDRLHCVDAHQSMGYVGIQAVEYGFSETWRHPRRNDRDTSTNRVTLAADLPDELLELLNARRVRTEERILIRECRIDRLQLQRADL